MPGGGEVGRLAGSGQVVGGSEFRSGALAGGVGEQDAELGDDDGRERSGRAPADEVESPAAEILDEIVAVVGGGLNGGSHRVLAAKLLVGNQKFEGDVWKVSAVFT